MSYQSTKFHNLILAASILTFMRPDKGGDGGAAVVDPPKELPVDLNQFLLDHPILETISLEIKKIVIDAGTQPRVAIDGDVINQYAEVIKAAKKNEEPNPFDMLPDDKLPQVFRDETGRCVLAEGFHRIGGHKLAHEKEMKVAVRAGTERDALLFSLGTNKEHGLMRTNKDKARVVKTFLKDPVWAKHSNSAIARFAGVSEFMVRDMRKSIGEPVERVVVMKGKTTTMNTSGIGKKGGKKATKKKAPKGGAAASTGKAPKVEDESREVVKIQKVLGGKEGEDFLTSIKDGSLELSKRDIRDWASLSDLKIKNIAQFVLSGEMKPHAANQMLLGGIPEKWHDTLHNLAIGNGGTYVFKGEGFKVTVEHTGKK